MKLSKAEKLILVMLSEIHEKLGIKDGTDTKLLTSAIYSDNTWALDWEMPGIVGDNAEPNPLEVREVTDILDMWSFIEEAHEKFNQTDKDRIQHEAEPFGKHVRFTGFDGNNESRHMSIARFLVEEMGRFSRFKGRDLNSHCPSVESNLRMLAVFEPIRPSLINGGLSPDQVIEILKAKIRK